MSLNPLIIAELIKECIGLIRDWRDPVKRRANYKLKLDKKANEKIEIAEDYFHTNNQYRDRVNVLLERIRTKYPDEISPEETKSLKRIERYLTKYNDKFRDL